MRQREHAGRADRSLQLWLLGQFDVRVDGKRAVISARAAQSLLAYLVLNAGVAHRREKLAGLLFPEMSDENARRNLRHALWRVRKAITSPRADGQESLLAQELTITFNPGADYWLDVAQLVKPEDDLQALLSNLTLYRGELLPGFYDDWAVLERERVQAVFENKLQELLERLITGARWGTVLEWAERWIALGQTPEPAYRALMIAHSAQGNMSQAALDYERCAEALKRDLGVEPSADTRALYETLSRGGSAASIAPSVPPILLQPSGTVTFLFTDIEGSTKLLERLGRGEYATLLADQRDLLREAAEKYHGHEVDTQGDAFFFAFFRAADAVSFAADAQRALASHPWPQGASLRVRMGLHTGEPMLARTGYVGLDVHRAARIGGAGHGGQVLMSRTTRDLVEHDLPPRTRLDDLGEHTLKDLRYPVHIIQLTVEDLPSAFPPLKTFNTGGEPPAPGEPPFKGLQYFDESDADLFFGRELLTAKLVGRLRESNFLAVVVGASGSGKSSIVRAGVIPALRRGAPLADGTPPPSDSQNWRIHVITPTAHPLLALATELTRDVESVTATATLLDDLAREPRSLYLYLRRRIADSGLLIADSTPASAISHTPFAIRRVLLVLDQFEELFTLCRDDLEREQFVDNLLTALSDEAGGLVTVILTLRADFYAHLAQYPELRDAVAQNQEYIGPMTTEELRRAIEEPAKQQLAADGMPWEFEPGLVDLILRDVGDEPGALPLLSHALLETWKRRSGHALTLRGYHEAGGVTGAIAQTAEATYQSFTSAQQTIARDIFLRLTELGEGTEDTRRRAAFNELLPRGEDAVQVRAVLTRLADARLITTGHDSAEVAHEALIREWDRLREWLDQNRDGLRLHRQLTEATREWELLEQDPGALYRGTRLSQANDFAQSNPNALNQGERAFLEASVENEQQEEREREQARQRELLVKEQLLEAEKLRVGQEQASNQRLRRRALLLAGALVLAILLAGIAFFFSESANRNASAAQENASRALANQNAAEAARLDAEKEKRAAFARELSAAAISNLDGDPERSVLLALEAVKATAQDRIALPEAQTALHRSVLTTRLEHTLVGHQRPIWVVKYSPDGTQLVTDSGDGTIRVWDPATGKELRQLPITPGAVSNLNFNKDGSRLGITDKDGESSAAKIWDIHSGELVQSFDLGISADKWWTQAYSNDFKRVAVTSRDGGVTVYDVASGARLFAFTVGAESDCVLSYSPDDSKIGVGCSDGKAAVYDSASGKELFPVCCHSGTITQVSFSPDGSRLATSSADSTAKVWDSATGEQLLTLTGHTLGLDGVVFSPDGLRIATTSGDQHSKIWDAVTGKEQLTLLGHTSFGHNVAFSPDGMHLASVSHDWTAKIWNITPLTEDLVVHAGAISKDYVLGTVVYSPDGARIAAGLDDGTVQLWDASSGKPVTTFRGHTGPVQRITFSADGQRLASASSDKTAKIWDVNTGKELLTLKGHTTNVLAVDFSPDGSRIATGSVEPEADIKIWDTVTGQELSVLDLLSNINDLKYSPDGKSLAVAVGQGSYYTGKTVHVFDLATGKLLFEPVDDTPAFQIAYSPDGSRMAVVNNDVTPLVFDARTGKQLFALRGLNAIPNGIAYDKQGTRLATANLDGTVTVWDAASGKELFTIYDPAQVNPQFAAFSPDGTRLAVIDADTLRVYLTRTEDLVALAKTRVTRALTQEECAKYLHLDQCPP